MPPASPSLSWAFIRDHTEFTAGMLAQGMQTPRADTSELWVIEKVSQKPKEGGLGDDGEETYCGDHQGQGQGEPHGKRG